MSQVYDDVSKEYRMSRGMYKAVEYQEAVAAGANYRIKVCSNIIKIKTTKFINICMFPFKVADKQAVNKLLSSKTFYTKQTIFFIKAKSNYKIKVLVYLLLMKFFLTLLCLQ